MKAAHKLLFVLCPMLVLGFIYYSSGKLHCYVWGQKPHKDVEPTVKVSKVTSVSVESTVTKEPVVEGPVSVGRIVGSGTASLQRVHSGQHENPSRPGSPEIMSFNTLHTKKPFHTKCNTKRNKKQANEVFLH